VNYRVIINAAPPFSESYTTNNQAFESTKENTLLSFHSHKSKIGGIKNTINQ